MKRLCEHLKYEDVSAIFFDISKLIFQIPGAYAPGCQSGFHQGVAMYIIQKMKPVLTLISKRRDLTNTTYVPKYKML